MHQYLLSQGRRGGLCQARGSSRRPRGTGWRGLLSECPEGAGGCAELGARPDKPARALGARSAGLQPGVAPECFPEGVPTHVAVSSGKWLEAGHNGKKPRASA